MVMRWAVKAAKGSVVILALMAALACGRSSETKTPKVDELTPIGTATQDITPQSPAPMTVQSELKPATILGDSSKNAPACVPRSQRKPKQPSAAAPVNRELSATFAENCAGCHGPQGAGSTKFPDIRSTSYQNLQFSVRSGRAGIMPAFDTVAYPEAVLDTDFIALTGKEIPQEVGEPCPIDRSGDNEQIVPQLAYRDLAEGPKALGLGFALDPFVLPYVMCKDLPSIEELGKTKRVCANVGISGSTEEGYRFADFGVCKDIRTQRPYRSIAVQNRNGRSDADSRLQDPKFAQELAWVTDQIRSSGCVCCHDSSVDKRTAFWDIAKDKVWTDQLDKYAVEVFTGRVDSTALGAYKPKDNFGFDRYHTGLPTTDVPRMQDFFKGLAKDLGTTEEEIKTMPPLADFLASQLREDPKACESGEGVDAKTMKVKWNTKIFGFPIFTPVRFVYILEEDAQTPLVTPNLDKPIGTLWRLDASSFLKGFYSNSIKYGEVPKNGTQTIPDPARFPALKTLELGKNYRIVVQLDVAFPVTNCVFKFGA